ncbi:Homeobox-leucine zipper protein [Musa troglodytarum]|uniref:Homeobox-leucine zipper protein n=1 Tax=Musa troglodytarum TaxID=320322 RepID=A0A9E7FIP6_9LILI|nr:Homeobox-leucine zipper protein [Musa troglodytarum]URD96656.1 Homeobox-leucine zipper protein [Musa troglodytarum]URD96657.1 Homeobox-leucine zipper protein [Musa troglodytarum]
MYGDCQVLSSMVSGNVASPDSLFSSPIQNPNLGFMANMPPFNAFSSIIPEEGLMLIGRGVSKEEEMESGSGSGPLDGVLSCGEEHDNELQQQPPSQQQQQPVGKRKRYHRHTTRQIQEMEALFKECPHPDEKQRMKLSQELGLKPRQVKFWFQNRRTQMKAQQDRADNVVLRAENESLKNENFRLQAAIQNVVCPNCGGPAILGEMSFDEQQLRIENARLKDELERLSCIASRYSGRQLQPLGPAPPILLPSLDLDMGIYSRHFKETPVVSCNDIIPVPQISDQPSPFSGMLILDQDKPLVLDLAITAADHLVRMCRTNGPLWIRRDGRTTEALDLEEHAKTFPWPMDLKRQHGEVRTEASRDSAMVIMNSITLVDAFLDADKWMGLFPSVVSKSTTVQMLSPGVAGHGNGCLHLLHAELQFLSPLVPAREAHFFRYLQHNSEEGTWVIVDFPVDGFVDGLPTSLPWYRRRTSGCVIQDMPNGYSKVMWVEHAEVEEDKPVHQIFDQFVSTGVAFGATRWVSTLQRQCERLASLMARNIADLGVIPSPEARKNMMKLSQRMMRTFCASVHASGMQSWTALSESSDDTIRVTTRKNTEPGQPNGVILTAVSTTWLPFSHQQVFELLTDEQRRCELDVLSSGNSLHEVAHIANGSHPRNCVSLLRVNAASNSSHSVELLLQESSTHPSGGSIVVYATIDVDAVQVAMSGEDPSYIPLLPTGFVISPAAPPNAVIRSSSGDGSAGTIGCLLTIGMQVLASAVPSAKLNLSSVTAINNHLRNTVQQISAVLGGGAAAEPAAMAPEQ